MISASRAEQNQRDCNSLVVSVAIAVSSFGLQTGLSGQTNLLMRRSLDAGKVLAELAAGLKDALDRALAALWAENDGVEAFAETMGKGNLAPEAKRKAVRRAKARLLAALQQVAAEIGWL